MCSRIAVLIAFATIATSRSSDLGGMMESKAQHSHSKPEEKPSDILWGSILPATIKAQDEIAKKGEKAGLPKDGTWLEKIGKGLNASESLSQTSVQEKPSDTVGVSALGAAMAFMEEHASAGRVLASAAFAEYIAMTLFVIIGCGSAMSVATDKGWVLQVALTFGLAISSLAYAVGHYSGGQINCAVTLGLVLAGKVSVAQGAANFVGQMLGSITGALILRGMFPEEKDKTGGLATNKVAEGWSQMNALLGEFAMTFLLMYVVMETAVNPASKANREVACLAIGFAVFLAHSVLIAVDGCSINPTRTFGPALVRKFCYKSDGGCFDDMWVFWVGPLLGAAAASMLSTSMMHQ